MNKENTNYIDGFAFPISRIHLDAYRNVAESVAKIWKEHGALAYFEYVGDDMELEGTRSFLDALNTSEDETVIFGWVVFESKAARDAANKQVAADPRMVDLIAPLIDPSKLVFDSKRMAYGGFRLLV